MKQRLTRVLLGLLAACAPWPGQASAADAPEVSEQGRLGLFPSTDFRITDGRHCGKDCRAPREGLWYFGQEAVAVPLLGAPEDPAKPPLVWLGAPLLMPKASLGPDGKSLVSPDGRSIPMELAPKLPANRSYFDSSTEEFFKPRSLRLRGDERPGGVPAFVARTIWPRDYRLSAQGLPLRPLDTPEAASALIAEGPQGPDMRFGVRVLWEREPGGTRAWAGKPVLGLILNGAQGDDDEALAGHFGVFTGILGEHGEWADWIVNNFYSLDVESEKGILASEVPMDNYLMDLNSGQSYYRPSYLTVAVLKDPRTALRFQAAVAETYRRYYRHELVYDHARQNCAGISMDVLRAAGWMIPPWGRSAHPVPAFFYSWFKGKDSNEALQIYKYLTEERTRLLPRAAFEAGLQDLLRILAGEAETETRTLTPYEKMLQDDVLAVLFVRVPQIPSSRAWGGAPVRSVEEHRDRVPADPARRRTIPPLKPRPFPPPGAELPPEEEAPAPAPAAGRPMPPRPVVLGPFPVGP